MKRLFSIILIAALMLPMFSIDAKAAGTTTRSNIIVFAYFTDDTADTAKTYFDANYADIKKMYTGTHGRSFCNYLKTISNNKYAVNCYFPQEQGDGKILSIPLSMDQATAKSSNVDATIMSDVLSQIPSLNGAVADCDGDGYVDNLTIICKAEGCSEGVSQGASLVAHSGNSGTMGQLGGLNVASYNILSTDRLMVLKSGLISHEYLHTLGYPDLYRTNGSGDYPVYIWDIMGAVSDMPSYPLAYLRSKISNWVDLTDVSESGTYTLSTQDSSTGNKAIVLHSALRSNEVFVVEYRKRPLELAGEDTLDRMLQGSGIIVYRIDTTVAEYSNAKGATGVYVFRPQVGQNGYIAGNESVTVTNAYLSSESERTTIGVADLDATLTDGALTFTNGENSGIVISEVGSSAGDTISFKVTFPDLAGVDLWEDTAFPTQGNQTYQDVALSSIGSDIYAAEYDGAGITAYKKTDSGWVSASEKIVLSNYDGEMKLFSYGGTIYIAYRAYDASGNKKIHFQSLNTSTKKWTLACSVACGGSNSFVEDCNGTIYVSYLTGSMGETANLGTFNGQTVTKVGSYHTSAFSDGRQTILNIGGTPYVFTRDASGDKLYGFSYSNGTFTKITNDSINCSDFATAYVNGTIYVSYVNSDNSKLSLATYKNGTWTNTNSTIDSSEAAIAQINGNIYVLASPSSGTGNFKMYLCQNGTLKQEGDVSIDSYSSNFTVLAKGDDLYLSYVRGTDKKSIIKKKKASAVTPTEPMEPTEPIQPTEPQKSICEIYGHSFTNYIYNNDATYTVDGTKTATCDNGCGTTNTITATGTMLIDPHAPIISKISNGTNGITLKWNKVAGVKGYYIYRKSGNGKYKKISTINSSKTNKYSDVSIGGKSGVFTYKVVAFKGKTQYASKEHKVVRLLAVNINSLSNTSKGTAKASWSKNATSNGYEVMYSNSSKFKNSNTMIIESKSVNKCSIRGLKKKKTCYVKVRPYRIEDGVKYYGAWSKVSSIKITK